MIRVGKIVATHGLVGDLIITHITGRKDWLKAGDVLFVALRKGSYIPYFVDNIKSAMEDETTIHFEETESVEEAKKLVSRELFVEEELLIKNKVDSPLLWIGFELIDTKKGKLGMIDEIFQTAGQWIAQFQYQDHEVLVPLVPQTLDKVDVKQKKVTIKMPEGLLEVYMD